MGMDVIGKKPQDKNGEHFRNNGWWWHPLWDYCSFVAPEICKKVKYAHSNDGDGLSEANSKKLSELLYESLKNGTADEYIKVRQEYIKSLPMRKCLHCRATGTRQWLKDNDGDFRPAWEYDFAVGLFGDGQKLPKYKSVKKRKNEKIVEEVCNACGGSGEEEPLEANYHINKDNIKVFARFLKTCGGFAIH